MLGSLAGSLLRCSYFDMRHNSRYKKFQVSDNALLSMLFFAFFVVKTSEDSSCWCFSARSIRLLIVSELFLFSLSESLVSEALVPSDRVKEYSCEDWV